MSTQANNSNNGVKARVITVIDTAKDGSPLMKTRADGSLAPYQLVSVQLLEGKASGKTHLAQRTLMNRDNVEKSPVAKGDEIFVIPSLVNGKVFLEISASVNATDEELMDAFGLTAETVEEPAIPLAEAQGPK